MTPAQSTRNGFSLIELIVTLGVLATLAMAVVPAVQIQVQRHKEGELHQALVEIRRAIDAYHQASQAGRIPADASGNGFPPNLQSLVEGAVDQQHPDRQMIYFLRRLPRDPFHPDANAPAEETWGLRSYESSAAEPREGVDVFDVYSRSERVGLNNVPYRLW